MKKICVSIILMLIGFGPAAHGQIGNESVFGFLEIPASARTAGLGGNHVSLYNAETALFTTNPAYLTETSHMQLTVSYLNHLADIYLGAVDFSYHLDNIGTMASGIRFVNYGDFTRIDSEGFEQGSFNAYDLSWSTAFSRELFQNFRGGIGAQVITSRYDSYQSTALAFFGGIYYLFNNDLTQAGLSFRHLGFQLTVFDELREDLPFTVTGGISHRLQHIPLRFNLALHSLNRWELPVFDDNDDTGFTDYLLRRIRFGMEILFTENVNLRLGYDHLKNRELQTDRRIDLSGTGIGFGIRTGDFQFDISRTSYSETGGLVQISVGTRF